ncbi:NADPH-dependent L-sorbose reductase [Ameyamaea chiangmaiensis NBRC 103196]|uniref:Mannitol dehydrogenase family protein n=1 Tax=Ameyamaea chiangmaiensis TaxID=442969 RepID=A0A850PDH7_9PROT|nr:mannitol dehydrogenase family protein [Ameyamaea chiangmaiensis]MBS4074783.1 mannitol dehydrogenase family protein [Ameyamaea chiangmaiensis]NVN40336.1 mannitol dehydrogenase family protein [Ameyamaea chiangmaiensis]GBQ62724.1 NADPH-dependent L-sorbose reductase [Ameyamaea chiangmaiensis NBRC 103196]
MNRTSLASLPAGVRGPSYDPATLTTGIVHFGVGNFFRAHEAYYIDKILGESGANVWGILGVGLTAGARSEAKAASFTEQDCLYSLTETAADGASSVSVIGAMTGYRLAPADPEAVLDALSSPAVKIVTMTITEGGYNIDERDGTFRVDDDAVKADLASPGTPCTIFGFVAEALRRRRAAGTGPFTVMSCDNLRHNGDVAKTAFVGFARVLDADLAAWIEQNVTFPNAMVDRITPTVTPEIAAALNAHSGLDDAQPLVAETFTQWVVEDRFCAGRPPLENAGVQFVSDVTGYEHVKVRMLNASHVLLGFPALLLGYREVDKALADDDLRALIDTFLDRDVIPQIEAPEGVDLVTYKNTVLERFSNAAMGDQLLRVCGDGSSKIQVFWTETMRRSITSGHDLSRLVFGMAAYLEMLRGVDENGDRYTPFEPTLDAKMIALASDDDLSAGLALPTFDGWRSLMTPEITEAVVAARRSIRDKGVRANLPR